MLSELEETSSIDNFKSIFYIIRKNLIRCIYQITPFQQHQNYPIDINYYISKSRLFKDPSIELEYTIDNKQKTTKNVRFILFLSIIYSVTVFLLEHLNSNYYSWQDFLFYNFNMDNEMKNMNISYHTNYKTYLKNVPETNTPFIFLIINFICYLYTFSPKVPINHSTILIGLLYGVTLYYFCIYILYIHSIHNEFNKEFYQEAYLKY